VPSKERVQRICRAFSDETERHIVRLDSKTLVEKLNRMMIGGELLLAGTSRRAYRAVDRHAKKRLRANR
jgi:hypothetical protein